MPHVDHLVLVLLPTWLLASVAYQWRRGLRRARLAAAALGMFYGLTLMTMLGAHCVDILYGLAHHLTSMTGAPFRYDWRTYSLLLFGALLITLGARALRAALAMARGEPGARTAFLAVAAIVLAIVVPLIPVNAFFGTLMTGASTIALLGVAAGMRPAATALPQIAYIAAAPAACRQEGAP